MKMDPLRPYAQELLELKKKKIKAQVDTSRQFQLIMALRNELFWRAKQFLKFKFINNGLTVVPIAGPPGASGETPNKNTGDQQALSYVFNITRADGQKFVAVTGQKAPYVNFNPKDAGDPDSLKAARDAKCVGRYLGDLWSAQQHQKDLARTIFRSGPQYAHLCWVTDGQKYGTTTVQDTEMVDVTDPATLSCGECGLVADHPDDAGPVPCAACGSAATSVTPGSTYQKLQATPKQVDRGMPEMHPYSIFEVSIPPARKSLDKCEWLDCETLELSGKLRRLYGDLVAMITDETPSGAAVPSQETAADAYDMISSEDPQSTQRADRWWWARTWLTPDMYSYASSGLRKLLEEKYAEGLRLVFVNEKYVEGVAEKLTDVWIVCKTGTDDRILGDPICHDLIPINEIINNFFNLAIETVLRGIPKTVVDPRLVDRKAIRENGANPNEIIFAKAGLGQDLSKMVAQLPTARFGDQMLPLAELFRQYSREVDGVLEAAFGGGEPAPTWRQDQQRKNQALAQMYTAYDEMRVYWENAYKLGLKLLAKMGLGSIQIPSDDHFTFGSHMVDLSTLTPDKVKIEAEEKMPQTRAEEEDDLREQFTYPPQVQEAIGIFHPVNVPRINSLLAGRGMTSPYAHLVEKTLKVIEQLVSGSPIPGQPDPNTGQPGPPQPSIMPDQFEFKNAAFAVEVVRAWCNSPAGMGYQQQQPDGYMNAKLFGQELEKMATPPPPPPPKPMPNLSFSAALDKLPPEQLPAIEQFFGINPPQPTGAPPIAAQFPAKPPTQAPDSHQSAAA